jgi:hypothetical protein
MHPDNNSLSKSARVAWVAIKSCYTGLCERFDIYIESAREFLWVYLVSNIPFLALVLMHVIGTKGAKADAVTIVEVISNNVQSGEIFIYISALLAPFVYVMIQFVRARRHMPLYSLFFILTVACYVYSFLVFGMHRLGRIENHDFVASTSIWFYITALVLWYFSLVFSKKLAKPPAEEDSGAQKILNNL